MSRKKRKNKKEVNPRIIKELSLIIPAFSYMWDRLDAVDDKSTERDVIIARALCKRMAMIIKRFSIPIQQKALELNTINQNKANIRLNEKHGVEPVTTETNINIFLLGVSLIAMHHEVKNKVLFVGYLDEIVELQDFSSNEIDDEMVNKTYDFANYVLEETFNNQ